MTFRFTRSSLLAFIAAMLLVLGQQAALRHELGHFKQRIANHEHQLPADKTCEQCGAFGQIAGGVNSPFHAFAVEALTHRISTTMTTVVVAADLPAFRNRGPPTIL